MYEIAKFSLQWTCLHYRKPSNLFCTAAPSGALTEKKRQSVDDPGIPNATEGK